MSAELTRVRYVLLDETYHPIENDEPLPAKRPEVMEEPYQRALAEINETYRIVEGKDGRRLEIAVVNEGGEPVLFTATSLSSLAQNPGNAIELAKNGAGNPNTSYIYVGHPGVYPSTPLRRPDQTYRLKTGRLTEGNLAEGYRSLESFDDIAKILESQGLEPKHVSADVEGGRISLALMAALPPNTIKDGLLNGLVGSPQLMEDIISRRNRGKIEQGAPGEVTKDRVREAKNRLPNIYRNLGNMNLKLPGAWIHSGLPGRAAHKWFGRAGGEQAATDVAAALSRQEAILTIQANRLDKDKIIHFGQSIMELIPKSLRSDERSVELLLGDQSTDYHTDEGRARLQVERLALRSIAKFSVVIPRSIRSQPAPAVPAAQAA